MMNHYDELTDDEVFDLVLTTVRKIANYPKEYGKTLENYFDVLFPNEVSDYLTRREINRQSENNDERRKSNVYGVSSIAMSSAVSKRFRPASNRRLRYVRRTGMCGRMLLRRTGRQYSLRKLRN